MLRVRRPKKSGFTLVEILVVVVILAVLGALIIPRILGRVEKAKEAEAFMNLGAIRSAEILTQNLTGKFVAAEDAAAIKAALGLSIDGLFYTYKIIDVTDENFRAVATPNGLLESWLQDYAMDKDGFLNYNPSSGGGSSSGGFGGSTGGSLGGGLGGISSGGSSGTVGGGGGTGGIPGITASGPVFNGYAKDIQAVFDALASSTVTFSSSGLNNYGLSTPALLVQWLKDNQIDVQFGQPPAGAGAATNWNSTLKKPYIVIGSTYQTSINLCANYLAHEASHALWFTDDYQHITTGSPYKCGTSDRSTEFGRNGTDTIDNEYNAYISGFQIWRDLGRSNDPYYADATSQASHCVNRDGTLQPESVCKEWIRGLSLYSGLPEY